MKKRVQVRVQGHVQGVGYRYYAVHMAKELGITGFVRNTSASGVETVGEGDENTLTQFAEAMSHGPHTATVTEVATAWSDASNEFADFSVSE